MKCPICGGNCVQSSEKVMDGLFQIYMPCGSCLDDPMYKKDAPLQDKIDSTYGRCNNCGKRHLDTVIGNVLTLMKDSGYFPADTVLKEVGTPLISFGYQVPYPPRLGNRSLVLIMDSVTIELADQIVSSIPEIKGVIKRTGNPSKSIGIADTDSAPHMYELLSGCDMRCDVIFSTFGELCIYKNQSMIHIEFNNTKIRKIESLYIRGELNNAVVVDGFSGPGTLGLLCALGGARKVILNDAWLPAVRSSILNIKANSDLLGVEIEFESPDYEKLIGDEPELIAKAVGKTEILVYHGDIRKLAGAEKSCDICLIDTFPSVDPGKYMGLCRDFARKIVII